MVYGNDNVDLAEGLFNFFLPQHCVVCFRYVSSSSGSPLCEHCLSRISFLRTPFCVRCGRPVAGGNILFCRRCRSFSFHFDEARAVTLYETPIRECIHALKYQGVLSFAPFFVNLLAEYMEDHPFLRDVDYILPVPLHPKRLKERGFNQTLLLARGLSARFGIPLLEKAVVRWKHTVPQVGLSLRERRKNVQNAFRIIRPTPFQGSRVLVIDDVLTSRATVDALSKILKEAGCATVRVLAIASGK
ncbi:MAG: ComF family protein [Candidatus Atribacteria bacterium]|nr:ComF family protein [Candidatus Atribacteria bacterium]